MWWGSGTHTSSTRHTQHGAAYKDRIANLQKQCHVIINVDNTDCIDGRECYFAQEPRIYEIVRSVIGCWCVGPCCSVSYRI